MIVSMMLAAALALWMPGATGPARSITPKSSASNSAAKVLELYPQLPIRFERNQGQVDSQVEFLAHGHGYTLFLTSNEAVLNLKKSGAGAQVTGGGNGASLEDVRQTSDFIRMKLTGSNAHIQAAGRTPLTGESNYFIGNDPAKWIRHIPSFAKVRYPEVYPGIDQVYYGNQGSLETDFVVNPGADPRAIRLSLEGAGKLVLDKEGNLLIGANSGGVLLKRPAAYQELGGRRQRVEARYEIAGNHEVRFDLGKYDRGSRLVIDPVLLYSTYLGGANGDVAYGILVDSAGEAIVTGSTGSNNFPTTSALQTAYAGDGDAFIVKLNASGTGVIFSTYLGGGGVDSATSITKDSAGNLYVAGKTYSSDFPVTSGAFQPTYGGNGDGFITKIDSSGANVVYSSYIGGSALDSAQGVAVDSSGNAYLTGSTQSSDFPTKNPLQIGNDGCSVVGGILSCTSDIFVTKVSTAGDSLIYSTYLGGTNADNAQAIAVDSSDDAYVAGYTFSSNFPTQSAFQSSNRGTTNAFISSLSPDGSSLKFSTYFGSTGTDKVFALALDPAGNIYVGGTSKSTDFPTSVGAFQSTNNGSYDAFVSKFSPDASSLVFSTLLGGSGDEQVNSIALDSASNVYVTGFTNSGDFVRVDPLQRVLGIFGASSCGASPCSDAFITEFGAGGSITYSTYLGGNGTDFGQSVAVDAAGKVYVAGATSSMNFPVIAGASQGQYAGVISSTNAFVARIGGADAPAVALNPQALNFGNQSLNTTSDPLSVTLINAGSAPLSISSISASGDFKESDNCGSSVPAGGGNCTLQITFTPQTIGNRTDEINITDNAGGSPQHITVTGNGVASSLGTLTITPTTVSFPAVTVGNTSPAQVVRLSNTGKASLTLSSVSITGDFAESNTCGSLPSVLNVGDGCTISVTFTPQKSGTETGRLNIFSDAAGATQSIPLTGTGNAVFTLAANTRSTSIQIGTASTTFTISASSTVTFTDSISLACTGGATCTFEPASITTGQSSVVTVSGLSATSANPFNFGVTGTSGGQSASVSLTIFLSDFTLSASPGFASISAGKSATYTITVTPTNNFNGVVLLSCGPLPQASSCKWTPSAVSLQGAPMTASLEIDTTAQSSSQSKIPPGFVPPFFPWMGIRGWILALMAVSLIGAVVRDQIRRGPSARARWVGGLRTATLCFSLLLAIGWVGCNNYYNGDRFTPGENGTIYGNYTIPIAGTLGNNNTVVHVTSVNLAVGP